MQVLKISASKVEKLTTAYSNNFKLFRAKCQRTGQSGCNPVVNGFEFNLCRPCRDPVNPGNNPDYCGWPDVYDCEYGCEAYDY